jgi:hypothetical protein
MEPPEALLVPLVVIVPVVMEPGVIRATVPPYCPTPEPEAVVVILPTVRSPDPKLPDAKVMAPPEALPDDVAPEAFKLTPDMEMLLTVAMSITPPEEVPAVVEMELPELMEMELAWSPTEPASAVGDEVVMLPVMVKPVLGTSVVMEPEAYPRLEAELVVVIAVSEKAPAELIAIVGELPVMMMLPPLLLADAVLIVL